MVFIDNLNTNLTLIMDSNDYSNFIESRWVV